MKPVGLGEGREQGQGQGTGASFPGVRVHSILEGPGLLGQHLRGHRAALGLGSWPPQGRAQEGLGPYKALACAEGDLG